MSNTKLLFRYSVASLFLAGCLIALATSAANAQVLYGSLVGTIQDSTGAVVPNAAITITNRGTTQVQETVSSSAGTFTFTNVLAGSYDLTVKAEGFRTYTQENFPVSVNTVRRTDVTLDVGAVTETVTVEAAALTLQTEKTDVSSELDSKAVANMPLPNYRNYQSLINLVPGATPARFQNSTGSSPARAHLERQRR